MTVLGMIFRPSQPPELLVDVARAADASGVDELWLWEDCFDNSGIAAAAAALAATERLCVGVGVLPVPLRNAALTAMEIATLERMFPGRVHIGLGHGVLDWMGQVGARVQSPMTLLREYVSSVRALLAGKSVTVEGRYVQLRDVQLQWVPAQPPPVHVGAVRPRTIALAGEVGDGLVLTGGTTPADIAEARATFDSARGNRAGRVTTYLMAVSGPDAEARYTAEVDRWRLREVTGHDGDFGVYGDAAAVAAGVRRWAAAGTDAVILQPTGDEDPVAFAHFAGTEVRPLL